MKAKRQRWHAILSSHLFRYTTIYLSPFEFRIFRYVPPCTLCALSLKFRHIYSIGWKYFLAHQKIAGMTFERTWNCTDFYEIENFNIKYLCREQKVRLPLRLELDVNAYLDAKTRRPKMIYARAPICISSSLICSVFKMIYVSKSIICSLI